MRCTRKDSLNSRAHNNNDFVIKFQLNLVILIGIQFFSFN